MIVFWLPGVGLIRFCVLGVFDVSVLVVSYFVCQFWYLVGVWVWVVLCVCDLVFLGLVLYGFLAVLSCYVFSGFVF